jgi:Putative transposase/Transposase zinc-binding domain
MPLYQHRLMRAIELCRTAAMGGHRERCDHCHRERISYNSCCNRHCPKCQNLARAKWLRQRKGELLPIEYFHVVFTIPEQLNALALQNKELVYKLLFQATAATLQTIAADPKHLGARIGFFSILHTWGQNLLFHPHIHCVATGGGLSLDGKRWVSCRPGFFLPVRVLSALFRRLLLEDLESAFRKNELHFYGPLEPLRQASAFAALLDPLRTNDWVVHAKPPFGGPQQVIEYLGRYTHRVAISNERLLSLDGDQVTFQYKDYRSKDHHKLRRMTISAEEFIRRFLLHSLPPAFRRVRHYGLLAGRNKKQLLALCRELLDACDELLPTARDLKHCLAQILIDSLRCPFCHVGQMIRIEILPRIACTAYMDTS